MPPTVEDLEEPLVDESSPLMSDGRFKPLKRHVFFSFMDASERGETPIYDTPFWRICHAFGFCLGGFFFLAGTLLYYLGILFAKKGNDDAVDTLAVIIGWLYIIGSCGFLFVDVQEWFTFTEDNMLRINISCSAFGSTLYVIGSAGFLPQLWAVTPLIGIGGFIGGSLAIGLSQTWKLYRILSSHQAPYKASTINAAFVEGGAMLGGYCFLIGTILFAQGPVQGDETCEADCQNYENILCLWTWGSIFFSYGGVSLAYRHAVMKLT